MHYQGRLADVGDRRPPARQPDVKPALAEKQLAQGAVIFGFGGGSKVAEGKGEIDRAIGHEGQQILNQGARSVTASRQTDLLREPPVMRRLECGAKPIQDRTQLFRRAGLIVRDQRQQAFPQLGQIPQGNSRLVAPGIPALMVD